MSETENIGILVEATKPESVTKICDTIIMFINSMSCDESTKQKAIECLMSLSPRDITISDCSITQHGRPGLQTGVERE